MQIKHSAWCGLCVGVLGCGAGLPIFPGLVRYEEIVLRQELRHAVRFTVSRSQRAIVAPARHNAGASDDPSLPPMGPRLRMKQSYDCSSFSEPARVICAGLERYGMIVADDGSDGYLSGAPDPRWDDDALWDLKQIVGDAFEVVDTGPSSGSDEGLAGSGVRGEGTRGVGGSPSRLL